jgi:hypothetical protein
MFQERSEFGAFASESFVMAVSRDTGSGSLNGPTGTDSEKRGLFP